MCTQGYDGKEFSTVTPITMEHDGGANFFKAKAVATLDQIQEHHDDRSIDGVKYTLALNRMGGWVVVSAVEEVRCTGKGKRRFAAQDCSPKR